ncbi:MAG: hypothetical protein AAFX52_00670 [Pseudomonadota bacterium]
MKSVAERNADILAQLAIAYFVGAFLAADTIAGSVTLMMAGLICYGACMVITIASTEQSDSENDDDGSPDH